MRSHNTVWNSHACSASCGKRGDTSPSLKTKRVSPHTIRHTTATHLLALALTQHNQSMVGHVSLDTTNIYAETDLAMKAKALAACIPERQSQIKKGGEVTQHNGIPSQALISEPVRISLTLPGAIQFAVPGFQSRQHCERVSWKDVLVKHSNCRTRFRTRYG